MAYLIAIAVLLLLTATPVFAQLDEFLRGLQKGTSTGSGLSDQRITDAFGPIVSKAMNEVGVTRQYKEMTRLVPFGDVGSFDLDRYVVGKALDGLFLTLGQEERKIRTNPSARITELLKDVFGR